MLLRETEEARTGEHMQKDEGTLRELKLKLVTRIKQIETGMKGSEIKLML